MNMNSISYVHFNRQVLLLLKLIQYHAIENNSTTEFYL